MARCGDGHGEPLPGSHSAVAIAIRLFPLAIDDLGGESRPVAAGCSFAGASVGRPDPPARLSKSTDSAHPASGRRPPAWARLLRRRSAPGTFRKLVYGLV